MGSESADRPKPRDVSPAEQCRVGLVDAAERQNGKRRRRREPAELFRPERRCAGVALRWKDRRQERRMSAKRGGAFKLPSVMAGGGYEEARRNLRRRRQLIRAQMNAVGADVGRENGIAANEEENAAGGANAAKGASPDGALRVLIVAKDDRRALRQDAGDEERVWPAGVGQKGERKRRGDAPLRFEHMGGG